MDPACFGSQRVVEVTVDDIARTIGVHRAALNVVCIYERVDHETNLNQEAAAKGLVAGCYRLTSISGEVTDVQASPSVRVTSWLIFVI